MMTRITTKQTTGSKAVPIALLCSLVLAIGVWFAPMPFLKAERVSSDPQTPKVVDTEKPLSIAAEMPTHDWLTLEAGLQSIRKPPPEIDASKDRKSVV